MLLPSEIKQLAGVSATTAKWIDQSLSEDEQDNLIDAVIGADEELKNDPAGAKLFRDTWVEEYRAVE